jgi:hypothetical protein
MNHLLVLPVGKPDQNKLEEAYEVAEDVTTKYGAVAVQVPKFFQYDGASVPPALWHMIGTPFQPRFMTAAVFHDWVYHTHQLKFDAANKMFYDLLVASGVRKVKAQLMLAAVENFGEWYWDNDADDRAYLKRLAERIKKDGRDPADYGMSG